MWQLEDKIFGNPAVPPGERAPLALEKWLQDDFRAYPTGDESDLRTLSAWFGEVVTLIDDVAALPTLYQPLDADLTAIAAISTTAYGRALLALANQAALVALLPAYQPLDTDLTTIAGLTATTDSFIQAKASTWAARSVAQVLVDLAVPGTTFQPLDADLTSIAAIATTAYGRAFLALANQAALVALLPSYQPLDTDLTTIAGLTATTDNFMIAASSTWASRTPTQAKTSLGFATTTTDNAIVRYDGTGGNQQNSAAIVDDTTGAIRAGHFGSTPKISIADDAVATLTIANYVTTGVQYVSVLIQDCDAASLGGWFYMQVSGGTTPAAMASALGSVATYTFSNTVMTGTTGTDVKLNLSCNGGLLYIENRLGSTRRFQFTFFGD